MNTRRKTSLALAALVLILWRVLLQVDFADLRWEIVAQPEPIPYNFADIERGRQEDAERQLRNSRPAFSPEGRWLVEKDFDHAAHWKWQMLNSETFSNPILSPSDGGANGRADLVPLGLPGHPRQCGPRGGPERDTPGTEPRGVGAQDEHQDLQHGGMRQGGCAKDRRPASNVAVER